MNVIVAEKPSVAQEIAKVVRATNKMIGYLEGNGYQVTWCYGHLCTLFEPEDYDSSMHEWKMETLPYIPQNYRYKVIADKMEQFSVVKSLLNSPNTERIIEATDAEREGELIFRLVYACSGCQNKNVYRLWINSLEEDAIRQGLTSMKSWSEYKNLFYAAACRQRADWLVGLNLTRYYSIAYHDTISCGRVQTPVLSFVVERDREIENFKPKDYYILTADMKNFKVSTNVETKEEADQILRDCRNKPCIVTNIDRKEHKKKAPKLYDLTTLQREANRFFGLSASTVLETAQSLYEKKLLTYPRTDSRFISFSDKDNAVKVLNKLISESIFSQDAVNCTNGMFNFDVIVNEAEVSDHSALLPTMKVDRNAFDNLEGNEKKILSLVCYKFLEAVSEPYEFISTKITADIGGHEFGASGKADVRNGWKAIDRIFRKMIDKQEKEPVDLPNLELNNPYQVFDLSCKTAKTQPPKRYTEDTLLSAMETCGQKISEDDLKLAMKERGLGTPATRASIIEGLIRRDFLERKNGKLISTSKGRLFISKVVPALRDPKMTGQWEKAIADIRNGKVDPREFMNGITGFVTKFFAYVKNKPIDDPDAFKRDRIVGKCPKCNGDVYEYKKSFTCENAAKKEDKTCDFTMWKNIQKGNTKKLSKSNAKKLLSDGKTDLISGLKSSKSDKEFSAYLVFSEDYNGYKFVFPGADDFKVGTCPMCKGTVLERKAGYFCENNTEGGFCKFALWKKPFKNYDKTITTAQAKKLIAKGKSDVIKGWKKEDKEFDAYLVMSKDGSIQMKFPEKKKGGNGGWQ